MTLGEGASSGGRGYGSSAGALTGAPGMRRWDNPCRTAARAARAARAAARRLRPEPVERTRPKGPGCNHGASWNETERKKKKGKESKMAFFCFLLVFGIGTFQRVMSEKSKKNLQRLNSRPRLWAKRLEPMESSGLLSVRAGPFHGGRASVCSSEICVSRLPNFGKEMLALRSAYISVFRHGRARRGHPREHRALRINI